MLPSFEEMAKVDRYRGFGRKKEEARRETEIDRWIDRERGIMTVKAPE